MFPGQSFGRCRLDVGLRLLETVIRRSPALKLGCLPAAQFAVKMVFEPDSRVRPAVEFRCQRRARNIFFTDVRDGR